MYPGVMVFSRHTLSSLSPSLPPLLALRPFGFDNHVAVRGPDLYPSCMSVYVQITDVHAGILDM